jgi:hypothetical protein
MCQRRSPPLQGCMVRNYNLRGSTTPYLDLELVCGGTRSSGYRQRPPGPPREMLGTHRCGQFFDAPLDYLELFTWQSSAGPREVLELEVGERPPSTLRNIDGGGGPLRGEDVDDGPPKGCWRQVRQRPPPKLKTSMGAPRGCWRQIRQRPPLKLKTSTMGPHRVLVTGPTAATTKVEDVDGGPPGGAGGRSDNGHRQS